MSHDRHVIFGAGLIGGYLAGVFLARGLMTDVIGREDKLSAFENGLRLSDFLGNELHVASVPRYQEDKPDVLWLTVKCTAVDASIVDLRRIVENNTVIICCQNGFGSDQLVRDAFPKNTVLNAVIGFNVAELSDGHLHRSTDGKLVVDQHSTLDSVIEQIDCAALPATTSSQLEAYRWAKLQLNLANPVNALSNIPIKSMIEQAGFRLIIADLMSELLNVVDAMEVKLPRLTAAPARVIPRIMRLPNWIFMRVAHTMLAIDPNARTSMWWDLKKKKVSEIDYLNGALVEHAAQLGLACPLNEALTGLLKQVERGEREIGLSANDLTNALYES